MANVAGKTTLQVGVDGAQAEAGIDGIKQSVRELKTEVSKTAQDSSKQFKVISQATDDAGNRISAQGRRTIKSLETQANRLELTTAEYAKLRAEQAGVANTAAPLIARIEAATKSTANLGMSAAATAAAMRNVPAQVTDIVVGLQGGQAPLTVLLQQGGQLKDMFGGIVPAAKALGSTIASMVNPFTLVIAGAAAVAAAYYKGSQETTKFNSLLLETGNYAGTTAAALSLMGDSVAKSSGGSRSTAVSALQEIAQSGKFAGDSLGLVAEAAVNLERVTGQEVGKTVQQFAKLQDEPTKAAAELNRQYNFLTASVYEQIKALEGQGQKTEAARVASEAFANAIESRKGQVVSSLGTFERAWDAIAKAAARARDQALAYGRDEGLAGQLRDAEQRLTQLQDGAYERGAANRVKQVNEQRAIVDELKNRVRMEQTLAAQQGATARAVQAQIEQSGIRSAYLGDSSRQTVSQQAQAARDAELTKFKEATQGLQQGSAEYERVYQAHLVKLDNIREQFAPKKTGGGGRAVKAATAPGDVLGDFITTKLGEEEQAYQSFLQRINGTTAAAEAKQRQEWLDRGLLAGELSQQQYSEALDRIQVKAGTTFTQTSEFAVQAARNIQDSLGDGLYDILSGNFDHIGSSFGKMILKMAADATAANLAQALFGDYGKTNQIGGLLGGLASSLFGTGGYGKMTQDTSGMTGSWGSINGRAIGGPVSSGSMYRVNENGSPELATVGSKQYLMMGNQSGSVTPLKALTGGSSQMAAPQVEFNLINQSSQPVQAKGGDMRFDGRRAVQDVFIYDMKTNGPMARAMKGVMG